MSNRVLFNSLLKVYSFPLTKNEIKEKFVPKVRLSLVEKASPIEKISLPLVQSPEILIKRDDLLDSYGSGNKLRKLEFLFGALSSKAKCRHIMTAGSLHSNHCKAVAVLAARFGFQAHLLLRTERTFDDENILQGNPLLSYLLGAKIYLIPRKASIKTEIEPRIQQMRENFGGENFTFSIPVGGSDKIGVFGYIDCFVNEILPLIDRHNIGHLVLPVSSGGTMEGLAIGNYFTGSRLKIHGFAVSDNKNYFKNHFRELLEELELDALIPLVENDSLIEINDQYVGQGYGKITEKQIEFIRLVSSTSGILFDPTYTGKCLWALYEQIRHRQIDQYSNQRKNILFLHTGGFLGSMNPDYGKQWIFSKKNRRNIRLRDWIHHETLD